MKLHIESTTKIVELVVEGKTVPARVWEGVTESGIKVHCYITRVAVASESNQAEFQAQLQECSPPSPEIAALPLRMFLP